MRIKQRRIWGWLLFIGISALLLSFWFVIARLPWHEKFHSLSAHTLYEEVLGKPVPAGVSNLRVAARSYSIKSWVWMRFNATDEVMESLSGGQEVNDAAQVKGALLGKSWVANNKFDAEDMEYVRWKDVFTIKSPEVYQLDSDPTRRSSRGYQWLGHVIIDRQNQLIYIHAGGD